MPTIIPTKEFTERFRNTELYDLPVLCLQEIKIEYRKSGATFISRFIDPIAITFHSSKGLEFDQVIVFTDDYMDSQMWLIWKDVRGKLNLAIQAMVTYRVPYK